MGILDKVKTWLVSSFISNWIRHGLTALSAVLVTQGIPADLAQSWQKSTEEILLQLLPVLLAILWSVLEKKYLKKALPMK